MRKLFLNPLTVLATVVTLFFVLKARLGHPAAGWSAVLFLVAYGYGCAAAYLAVFCTSRWVPVLKRMGFPEAYGNRVFMAGIGFATLLPRILIGSALAIFVFGAAPGGVASFSAALLAVSAAAATVPLMHAPSASA